MVGKPPTTSYNRDLRKNWFRLIVELEFNSNKKIEQVM